MRYQNLRTGIRSKPESRIKSVMIEGVIPVVCIFCKFMTCIQFDLELHLYESHRTELVKLPIGKGSVDFRIEYAINEGRRVGASLRLLDQNSKQRLGFEKT
ncbi:MAG: hypothetical protein WA667_22355 [Candidatus Nitrosopolaris sp.]